MINVPYTFRVVILFVFASIMILRDRLINKRDTRRQWEYGSCVVAGFIGAVYGALNDAVTVNISPEYFILGKGIPSSSDLIFDAVILGAQAGFSAGFIVCIILHFAFRQIETVKRCQVIFKNLWILFVLSFTTSLFAELFISRFDPLNLKDHLIGVMSQSEMTAFLTVWWIHMGAYFGLIAGLVIVVFKIKRKLNK